MTKQLTLQDYLRIARRRKWLLIIPPVACGVLSLAISFFLSPRYTSQTLVLVEGQKVSDMLVKPAVAEDLNQRLSTMKEQILSRSRLEPIMQKFGLYKDEVKKVPMEDLIDEMRSKILVSPIHGANDSTPGFYISFTADNPKLAQDVCAEITSLFMEENLKLREERAVGTTDFLTSQLEESKRNLDEQEAKLAAFQRKYADQSPGQEQVNMNMLSTLKTQLDGTTEELNRAQQDKLYTESLLAQQTSALTALQTRQTGSAGNDVISTSEADAQLAKLKEDLTLLETRYTPEHPDVIKTKQAIAQLEKKIEANNAQLKASSQDKQDKQGNSGTAEPVGAAQVNSPAIQRLRDNLHVLNETIQMKSVEQTKLQAQIRDYERRIELSPQMEEEYKKLTRDHQTAQEFYDDLMKKKSMSEMSTDLERRQEGEQFRIVDPANLPEKPSFPSKPLFGGGGFTLGLLLAGGLAMLLEISRQAIQTEADVQHYLKLPVIVSIPVLTTPQENETSSWLRRRQQAESMEKELVEEKSLVGKL